MSERRRDIAAARSAGPPPDEARLTEAAVAHLARFAATEAGLRQVLARRVDRWARAAEAEGQQDVAGRASLARQQAAIVARKMVARGAVDDAAFAGNRARRLLRGGRSPRAALAHLRGKGVDAETAAAAVPEDEDSALDAALAFCRRRRIGPFATAETDAAARNKALGALARGGFSGGVARAALAMERDAAEARLIAARRE